MLVSMSISQLMVSVRVFFMPLIYSKVILKGEISTAQLLTFEFNVFLVRNFFKFSDHFAVLCQHQLNSNPISL